MKLLAWLKGLSWLAIGGAILAAIGMVLNAYRAGKMEAQVVAGEAKIDGLRQETVADLKAARKLQDNIAAKKIEARAVRKKSEKSLERLGQDETMADIAKRFNGKRVRRREDPTP